MARASAPISIRILPPSALTTATSALAVGESIEFTSGAQAAFSEADLAWQTAFFHDDTRGLIHLMGKPANADTSWMHQHYTVATNEWTVVGQQMWNNPGHIYGGFTMDYATGDVFQMRGGADNAASDHYRRAAWWTFANRTWGYTPVDLFSGALVSHTNGIAYHPNLYGPGNGGLIADTQFRTLFWRASDNTVEDIPHAESAYGDYGGVGCYWPARDLAFVGGASNALLKVAPNGGSTPIVTALSAPPVALVGASHESSTNFGSLHVHPGDPNKLLIVETVGPRAWTSTDGATWTPIANHPFTRMPRVICSLRGGLGCLWAIGRDGSGDISTLWKPAP